MTETRVKNSLWIEAKGTGAKGVFRCQRSWSTACAQERSTGGWAERDRIERGANAAGRAEGL